MDPCPGCSLGRFSGRESGGGKVHLFFFMEDVALVPDFIHIYLLLVKGQEKICLVLHVLPSMQWQRGFW